MLTSLRLQDFKSFANETVPLAPLTVLVGENASGKSNALDAIRFLQGVALELPISDVLRGRHEGGREVWPAIRGGISEVARFGREEFELQTVWSFGHQVLVHQLRCGTKPVPLVHRESLSGAEKDFGLYLYDTHAKTLGGGKGLGDGRAISVALKGTGGKNPTQRHSAAASLMGQIQPGKRVHDMVLRWTARVQAAMRSATFLSISPAAMRDYAPAQALDMGADGSNISAIVKQLCERPGWKERLVDWLSELCAPKLADIDFVETELGDVMLVLVEEDGSRVSARSLSDGTLRFLGELVALQTAKPGSILLIEEIENGLHPQRLHLLVELLEGATKERGIQVIATTHSPLVLTALSKPALESAVVFARVSGREGTLARRLGSLPHFEEVAKVRRIDELFASGWLERAL